MIKVRKPFSVPVSCCKVIDIKNVKKLLTVTSYNYACCVVLSVEKVGSWPGVVFVCVCLGGGGGG